MLVQKHLEFELGFLLLIIYIRTIWILYRYINRLDITHVTSMESDYLTQSTYSP